MDARYVFGAIISSPELGEPASHADTDQPAIKQMARHTQTNTKHGG